MAVEALSDEEDRRHELIEGVVYLMSSPSVNHQLAVGLLYAQLLEGLKGKSCTPFVSPLDVYLFEHDRTFVQPDIFVVCDKAKQKGTHIRGAPDLIAEVFSPGTYDYDILEKAKLYAKAGVKEYWLVDIEKQKVIKGILEGLAYDFSVYGLEGKYQTELGLALDFTLVADMLKG